MHEPRVGLSVATTAPQARRCAVTGLGACGVKVNMGRSLTSPDCEIVSSFRSTNSLDLADCSKVGERLLAKSAASYLHPASPVIQPTRGGSSRESRRASNATLPG
jgi:hypothetical protein